MKRLINFRSILILLTCLLTSSCITNNILWVSNGGGMAVKGFFIDKNNHRVVLVNHLNHSEPHTNYSITDKEGKIFKVFELAEKTGSKDVAIYFNQIRTKGSRMIHGTGWINYNFNPGRSSKEDEKYLRGQGLIKLSTDKKFEYIHYDFNFSSNDKMKRYPSSKEKFTNFCSKTNKNPNCAKIIKFETGWKGRIWHKDTTPKLIAKSIATPFTVAADIILIPFQLLVWLAVGIGGGA